MKLATLEYGGRDGSLIVVNKQLTHFTSVPGIANTLQAALDNWEFTAPQLQRVYKALNSHDITDAKSLDTSQLAAPLPRAYQWLDGSAYLSHVQRVRKARGADMPASFNTDPLMYQGGSDHMLGPTAPMLAADAAWGIDCEAEIAVITDDVPMGIAASECGNHIKLIMLVNDISLRNLIPEELAKGFGFLHGKPPTAFSPVAVTPDELGNAWRDFKVALPLITTINNQQLGNPNAGVDMQFNFTQLIAHAAKTRPLSAGTIIGSGTVSNYDISTGCSCLVEKRVLEIIDNGQATTPFLQFSDRVRIEMLDAQQQSIFGAIDQEVIQCQS